MESSENQSARGVLRYEEIAPHVYVSLQKLKRTGWVERGVENPESVKEHTEALLALAQELLPALSDEEKDHLIEMLEVHDWPEATYGDEVILELKPNDQKDKIAQKFEDEKRALQAICEDLPNGEEILKLWLRFETSDDVAATFARQLDKYQAVEKALEYEEEQGITLFDEFLKYSINFISHPVLLERVEKLKLRKRSL